MDKFVLLLLLAQLLLGLFSITVSLQHMDGAEMIKLMTWAQHIVTFRGDAAELRRRASRRCSSCTSCWA